MEIKDLVIDAYATVGRTWLVDVTQYYEYKNGVPTNNIEGFKYNVALPEHKLSKIAVKIKGRKIMDTPAEFEEVVFKDLEIYLYMDKFKQLQIGARATGISVVEEK